MTNHFNIINEQLQQFLLKEEKESIDPQAMLEMATIVTDRKGKHIIKNISTNPDATRNWYGKNILKFMTV